MLFLSIAILASVLTAGGVAAKHVLEEEDPGEHADPFWVRLKTNVVEALSVMSDRRRLLGAARSLKFEPRTRQMAPGHSHPGNAALRADASHFISLICAKLGGRRFDVAVSPRELHGGAAGARSHRNAKDLLNSPVAMKLLPTDVVTFVDVECHMTSEELARYAGHHMVLYTLTPDGLQGTGPESMWRFDSEDTVVEEVDGGAVYRHKVWNWNKDMYVMSRKGKTYVYDAVKYPVGEGRSVVALVLARVISAPLFMCAFVVPDINKYRVERMQVTKQGPYLVGHFGSPREVRVCVLPLDSPGAKQVTVAPEVFKALAEAAKIPNHDKLVKKSELSPAGAERVLRNGGHKGDQYSAHVLSAYFTNHHQPLVYNNYQARGPLQMEDGTPTTVLAAVPLVGPGYGPTQSSNNELRAVETRIQNVANDVEFSPVDAERAEAFVKKVVGRFAGKVCPIGFDELQKLQDKSAQKARRVREEPFVAGAPDVPISTSSFQKMETGATISDPRLINQVPTTHTNRLSMVMYAMKPVLSQHRWYMPGCSPEKTAQRLRGLHNSAGGLVGGDYSRMDGRMSVSYRRHVFEPVVLGALSPVYREEVRVLLEKEREVRTITKRHKHKAVMRGANISGSPVTTALNTLSAAFNEFAARMELGQGVDEAFSSLGAYFGDDSLTDRKVFGRVMEMSGRLGMKMTEEAVPEGAGEGCVVFLGRVYPDIRTSLASHPEPVRNLRKLCTVQAPPSASQEEVRRKLALKVRAVTVVDGNVPLISTYARALERVYKLGPVKDPSGDTSQEARDYVRKVAAGPFPYKPGDHPLLEVSMASGLGMTVERLRLLDRRLGQATTVEDLAAIDTEVPLEKVPEWAYAVPRLSAAYKQ